MPTKNPKDIFLMLLSDARQNTQRMTKVFQDISQVVQDPDVKEALEARVFISDKMLSQIDQCFKLLGEEPVKLNGRVQEVIADDFRRELAEIQGAPARHLYVLVKTSQFSHLQIGEFAALTAAADLTGHFAVGVLLESCLADKLAFVERTRRLVRNLVEGKLAEKLAA